MDRKIVITVSLLAAIVLLGGCGNLREFTFKTAKRSARTALENEIDQLINELVDLDPLTAGLTEGIRLNLLPDLDQLPALDQDDSEEADDQPIDLATEPDDLEVEPAELDVDDMDTAQFDRGGRR